MIVYSGNSASNALLAKLGKWKLCGWYCEGLMHLSDSHGFSDMTVEYNGFNDPGDKYAVRIILNQVAAKDCGKLLEEVSCAYLGEPYREQ